MSGDRYYEGNRVIKEEFDNHKKILTRYVEKPVEEVRIVEVPKVTYIDVVKQIPETRVETVEKEVEELFIREVIVEKPVIHEEEIIKHVPVKKIVEVPVERVREVKVDQHVTREEVLEVPGVIIEQPRHYEVEKPLVIPHYNDTMKPTVYQQLIKPVLRIPSTKDTIHTREVEVYDYDPVLCKVLVHIPKPVNQPVIDLGPVKTEHKWLSNVPNYDDLIRRCNPHLDDNQLTGLLSGDSLIQPIPDTEINGLPVLGIPPPTTLTTYKLTPPVELPPGRYVDPRPVTTATYVNQIAREVSHIKRVHNPQFIPAIDALKELRKHKYADPVYEKYLKQHHQYFAETARGTVSRTDRATASMSRLPTRTNNPLMTPGARSRSSSHYHSSSAMNMIPRTARAATSRRHEQASPNSRSHRESPRHWIGSPRKSGAEPQSSSSAIRRIKL